MPSTMMNTIISSEAENAQRAHLHRPRIERCGFYVKNDKKHRNEIEAHRKPSGDRGGRLDAAFVGFGLFGIRLATAQQARKDREKQRRGKRDARGKLLPVRTGS